MDPNHPNRDRRIAYSNAECFDMIFVYGECHGNSRLAAMEYALRYPERPHPPNSYFHTLAGKLQRTGSFHGREGGHHLRPGRATPPEMIEAVREAVTNSPHTSTRKLGRQLGATQKVAHKILKKHLKRRPWKRHTTQKLVAQDHARRLEFCEFMIERVSFHGPIRIVNRSFRFFFC